MNVFVVRGGYKIVVFVVVFIVVIISFDVFVGLIVVLIIGNVVFIEYKGVEGEKLEDITCCWTIGISSISFGGGRPED